MRLPSFVKIPSYKRFSYTPRYSTTKSSKMSADGSEMRLQFRRKSTIHQEKTTFFLRLFFITACLVMFLGYMFYGVYAFFSILLIFFVIFLRFLRKRKLHG